MHGLLNHTRRLHLVSIDPGQAQEVPLYWHTWRHSGRLIERLTAH
ncbi:hypothetical protein FHR95_001296 [Halomonas fontilapidosi]|uniref:Uncharacterized protein n=1 Tax=Halomonas fontilapidosi TaxID=616675 RepID=A0A7W5DIU8_9GAMM|nr:hypothetical protein [Halomonas fontilapidosi]MBB3183742.1 hypothetical protein [Halomonas fontilapidosi]